MRCSSSAQRRMRKCREGGRPCLAMIGAFCENATVHRANVPCAVHAWLLLAAFHKIVCIAKRRLFSLLFSKVVGWLCSWVKLLSSPGCEESNRGEANVVIAGSGTALGMEEASAAGAVWKVKSVPSATCIRNRIMHRIMRGFRVIAALGAPTCQSPHGRLLFGPGPRHQKWRASHIAGEAPVRQEGHPDCQRHEPQGTHLRAQGQVSVRYECPSVCICGARSMSVCMNT